MRHYPIAFACLLAAFNLSSATLHVSLESTNPVAPYEAWATAANVIQDAVAAAQAGDTVLVTDGLYAAGGRTVGFYPTTNRVAVDRPLVLRSVNGPQSTIIPAPQQTGASERDPSSVCHTPDATQSRTGIALRAVRSLCVVGVEHAS